MTTTTRTQLALAACEGLSDAELAERGAQGFAKMILRKRNYATAARALDNANQKLAGDNKALKDQLAAITAKYDELLASTQPQVDDLADAEQALAKFTGKK